MEPLLAVGDSESKGDQWHGRRQHSPEPCRCPNQSPVDEPESGAELQCLRRAPQPTARADAAMGARIAAVITAKIMLASRNRVAAP